MGPALPVFNLRIGKGTLPYQDVISANLIQRKALPSEHAEHARQP